jgi:hypothetical protein
LSKWLGGVVEAKLKQPKNKNEIIIKDEKIETKKTGYPSGSCFQRFGGYKICKPLNV